MQIDFTMDKNLKQIEKYFESFAEKDIDSLENLFSEDVQLHDWNASFVGRDAVLKEVGQIFSTFGSIKLEVHKIFPAIDVDNFFACQIEIVFDGNPPLYIMDLIKFDSDNKIIDVTAYNRNFGK